MKQKKWLIKPLPNEKLLQKLTKSLSNTPKLTHRIYASLLLQRGIFSFRAAQSFFNPALTDLHDPLLMKGMEQAVERILKAIETNQRILIFGDYDVDGTCAVSLLNLFFNQFYPNNITYVPDRYAEGYGVSTQGIDFASDNGVSLIITVDCGIKSADKIAYATSLGIDTIVCDHHQPDQTLPNAVAILNPKQKDCSYPYKELCGCGIAFKLAQALLPYTPLTENDLFSLLDLVALATCADIVPMNGENRILVAMGLKQIQNNPSAGIRSLVEQIGEVQSVRDIVFGLAPRINAAGRLEHGSLAIHLLTANPFEKLPEYTQRIEELNSLRKKMDSDISEEALLQIKTNMEEKNASSVVYAPTWSKGVIGIVAARLTEIYYRPTIVFTKSGDMLAGSARSVTNFNIYEAIEKCSEHLIQFGGHQAAAGLTLLPENYQAFKTAFEKVVRTSLPKEEAIPQLSIDVKIPLECINTSFYNTLQRFEPFGPENMTPVFLSENLLVKECKQIGKDKNHLKLSVKEAHSSQIFPAIAFGMGSKYTEIQQAKTIDLVYTLQENVWQGTKSIQLQVRDIRTHS